MSLDQTAYPEHQWDPSLAHDAADCPTPGLCDNGHDSCHPDFHDLGVHAPTTDSQAERGEALDLAPTETNRVPLQAPRPVSVTHLVPGTAVRLRLAGLCLLVLAAATVLAVGLAGRIGGVG